MNKIDLHAHSMWSDGSGTIEEMTTEYERLGFIASIITDHDYMIKDKYVIDKQREEIKELNESSKFSIPIIQGCEITLTYGEEAILFGEKAIDHWFTIIDKKEYEPGMFDDFNHAIIWVHPRIYEKYSLIENAKFLSSFHGFEIENGGKHIFSENYKDNGIDKINKIQEFIKYEPYKNSDAHSVRMIKSSCNEIDRDITNEKDLIDWIKSRKI